MFATAHGSQVRGAAPQAFFATIQAAAKQIPPQSHGALAAAEKARIPVARIFGGALDAPHQAVVGTLQSTGATLAHGFAPARKSSAIAAANASGRIANG